MKRFIVGLGVALAVSILAMQTAGAHVLVTDDTGSSGAILHITPDDDPIAGQPARLFFDTQLDISQGGSVGLTVRDYSGDVDHIELKTDDRLATASYVFAGQGVYQLEFAVTTDSSESYTFHQSQRVSRGATTSMQDTPSHEWAIQLLVASLVGLALTLIVAYNRRQTIAKQSYF